MAAPVSPARSRAVFWLIFAVAAAPVILSYLTFYFWPPDRTTNYGELVEAPGRFSLPRGQAVNGGPADPGVLRGKWLLVALGSGNCATACSRNLLYMRQLRLTQGKDQDRIERVWIVTDRVAPSHDLLAGFPGMHVVHGERIGLARLFPAPKDPAEHIYVVDPLGNIVLRFPPDPDPRRMIKDLARLLKASQIG